MRMLGPSGNPQARNLLDVFNHLQKADSSEHIGAALRPVH
jgi:hypothetical protein